MPQELFAPRADFIDPDLWIETLPTFKAYSALWHTLELSRQQPTPWMPIFVLCGESGSGRTRLATRFARAARRSVACDMVQEAVSKSGPDYQAERDRQGRANAAMWADQMARAPAGNCPAICSPTAWMPPEMIAKALQDAQDSYPALELTVPSRPDREIPQVTSRVWNSAGNFHNHPTRRTTMIMFDDADRLLSVPQSRRRGVLDEMFENAERFVDRPLAWVLIGSQVLVDMLSEYRTIQTIRIEPMKDDYNYAEVCGMVFGTTDAETVTSIHQKTRGLMGPTIHLARMMGLKPPYHIAEKEILRLPSPAL